MSDLDDDALDLRNLSKEEKAAIRDVFNVYDDNLSGSIDIKELPTLLRYLHYTPTEAQCAELMKKYDKNGDGTLSLQEIFALCANEPIPKLDNEEALRKAFRVFDRDNSGKVSFKELKEAMCTRGEPLREEELTRLFKEVDDGDGELDFEEFCAFIHGKGRKAKAAW